jgi:hypothetical protein
VATTKVAQNRFTAEMNERKYANVRAVAHLQPGLQQGRAGMQGYRKFGQLPERTGRKVETCKSPAE